ncbi:MAG: hypothetical protein Q9227_000830 [Pyrenula ochraceoflavens]
MGLGVLEDHVLQQVPGSVDLVEDEKRRAEVERSQAHLKKDKTGRIVLVPQPSDDPNDPLNWALWKRDLILLVLCFSAVISSVSTPQLAAISLYLLTNVYHGNVGYKDVALLTGWHLCGVAERGPRMALTNVALFGAAFLTPVCVGKITQAMGFEWSFYFMAIFAGVAFPFLFFFVPETAFNRAFYLNLDFDDKEFTGQPRTSISTEMSTIPSHSPHDSSEGFADKEISGMRGEPTALPQHDALPAPPPKHSWAQRLKPFNGRYTSESFFKLVVRPFPLFLHPAIVWAALIQGAMIGWTVLIGVILASVFATNPTFLNNEARIGYLYTGPFIGSIVGLVLSGLFADIINRVMIRLNHGRYEPEFRILLAIPMTVFCGAGLYGFGITANNTFRYGWLVPTAFFMLATIGMVIGAVASALYIVDAHRDIAVEAFTCLMIFKNLFSFILTWYAFDWVFKLSKAHLFVIVGSVQMGICALSIPMCM